MKTKSKSALAKQIAMKDITRESVNYVYKQRQILQKDETNVNLVAMG